MVVGGGVATVRVPGINHRLTDSSPCKNPVDTFIKQKMVSSVLLKIEHYFCSYKHTVRLVL